MSFSEPKKGFGKWNKDSEFGIKGEIKTRRMSEVILTKEQKANNKRILKTLSKKKYND